MSVLLTIIERGAGPIDLNFEDSFYERKLREGWVQGRRVRFGHELDVEDEWFVVDCMYPAMEEAGEHVRDAYIRICQPTLQ